MSHGTPEAMSYRQRCCERKMPRKRLKGYYEENKERLRKNKKK